MAITLSALAMSSLVMSASKALASDATEAIKYLPVQDAGRIKPLDTLARESLQLIYGSETYRTQKDETRSAVEIVTTWMLLPQYWDQQKIVEVSHKGLKDSLKLELDRKYFSPAELLANPRFSLVMQELGSVRATKAKLSPYYQAVQRLETQLGMYQAIKGGQAVRVVPPTPQNMALAAQNSPDGRLSEQERWVSVAELQGDLQEVFVGDPVIDSCLAQCRSLTSSSGRFGNSFPSNRG